MFDNNVYGLVAISMIKELRQMVYRETAVSTEVTGQQSPEKGSKPLPCTTHPSAAKTRTIQEQPLPTTGRCLI